MSNNNEMRRRVDEVIEEGPEKALNFVLSCIDNYKLKEWFSWDHVTFPPSKNDRKEFEIKSELRRLKARRQFECIINYFKSEKGLELSKPQISALVRYSIEGLYRSYKPDISPYAYLFTKGLYDIIEVYGLPVANGTFLDFGCGNSVEIEKYNRSRRYSRSEGSRGPIAYGIELSPTFALDNPQIGERDLYYIEEIFVYVGLIDEPLGAQPWILAERPDLREQGFDCTFSSLTLDRVRNPKQLIANMFDSAKQGGVVAMGNLFPVVPEDDGPEVKNKIIYTPEENRLTPGASEEEDRDLVKEYIEDTYRTLLTAEKIPYTCQSADGEQVYPNYWMLTCRKS